MKMPAYESGWVELAEFDEFFDFAMT